MNKQRLKKLEKSVNSYISNKYIKPEIKTYTCKEYKEEMKRRQKEVKTVSENENNNSIDSSRISEINFVICETREDADYMKSLKKDS